MSDCGVQVPGSVNDAAIGAPWHGLGPAEWCNNGDLDAMYVNQYVMYFVLGSVQATSLWQFNLDFDHMTAWRDNGIIIPPVVSAGAPTGILPAGTANTTLNVTTDVNASCQYSNVSNTAYTNGTAFNTTGTTTHSTIITGLQDNTTYNYYIRCANATNTSIVDTTDYAITFTVGISLPPNIADINQDHIVNMADMLLVINDLGKTNGFDPKEDINSDGKINVYDLVLVGQNWGRTS